MNICIFEDEKVKNFHPLSLSRPVYQLRCGIFSLAEKIKKCMPGSAVYYHCRLYIQPLLKLRKNTNILSTKKMNSCLFINGRIIADKKLANKLWPLKDDVIFTFKGEIIAAYITKENLKKINLKKDWLDFKDIKAKRKNVKVTLAEYIWDLVENNETEVINDAENNYELGKINGKIYPQVTLINKKRIFIEKNSKIKSGAVIDAEKGPVVIERGTEILPLCTITGPVFIGKKCLIKSGAKIYPGTTIGQASKIGGEIEESIIHEFSNKQHEGFLGHSYIGSWCNLGADTNNSDLKNNYGPVTVIMGNNKINTRLTFVGLFMGDHSKTGINTMFNTGTVVGFSANVFGAGYLPKCIPSFAWFDAQKGPIKYKLDKAMDTAKKVMSRRQVKFTKFDNRLFNHLFSDKLQ
ncbi:transferase [Patescibacteria group bacterium]|nr:transferase [Patescibacteria group bacterium]